MTLKAHSPKKKPAAKKSPAKKTPAKARKPSTAKKAASRRKPSRGMRKTVQPRRPSGALKRLVRRLPWRPLALVAVATAALGGGHWLWNSGHIEAAGESVVDEVYAATAEAGFEVTSIQLLGRTETEEAEILAAIETERGAAILRFDPVEARAKIEALPWVETATVERRLPNRILISISEKRPAALWQSNGQWAVIDSDGKVIEGAAPGAFAGLPKLVGEGAQTHAAEILELTESQPHLAKQVYAAIRVGNRRWNLRLHSGIDVRLPENDMISAWERLARLESVADLLSRDVTVIDLRRDDRLLLRLAPDAEIQQPVEGQET